MNNTIKIGKTTYKVKKNQDESEWTAYILTGPRGAKYALFRNANQRHMLFAMNMAPGRRTTPFDRDWFTDKDGELRIA